MDGICHWLLEYAFELSSYGSLVPCPFGRCGSYIEIILSEVARCMNYFLSLCRDFPWTTHWSIFAVFCFLSWLLGYFSASCIRSLSRIRWKVMKCLRVSLRLLTGFFSALLTAANQLFSVWLFQLFLSLGILALVWKIYNLLR